MSCESSERITQIDHIALATSDLGPVCDFYRRLGGVAVPASAGACAGDQGCMLDFCGVRLEVFERPRTPGAAPGRAQSPWLLHLGFSLGSADAVDELSRVLGAAGHCVLEPPHRTVELGRYESLVLDPDGNRLKLGV